MCPLFLLLLAFYDCGVFITLSGRGGRFSLMFHFCRFAGSVTYFPHCYPLYDDLCVNESTQKAQLFV